MQAPAKTNVSEILRSMTPNLFDRSKPENHKADHKVWNRVARSNPEVRQLCAALLFVSTKKRVAEREVRTSYDTVVYVQGKDGSYVRSYAETKKVIYELPKLVKDVIYLVMDTYVKEHVKLSDISMSHQIRELCEHASANFIKTGLRELGLDVEKLLDIVNDIIKGKSDYSTRPRTYGRQDLIEMRMQELVPPFKHEEGAENTIGEKALIRVLIDFLADRLELPSTSSLSYGVNKQILNHVKTTKIGTHYIFPNDYGTIVPRKLCNFSEKLTHLIFTKLGYLSSLPLHLRHCKNVESISLSNSKKIEVLPFVIGLMENLKELDLSYTGISSLPDDVILEAKKLEKLDISGTNIQTLSPKFRETFQTLKLICVGALNGRKTDAALDKYLTDINAVLRK